MGTRAYGHVSAGEPATGEAGQLPYDHTGPLAATASRRIPAAMRCCLMVLNYNGKAYLEDCFRTLQDAASRSSVACSVVCVDNRSTDDDVEWLRRRFPEVQVIVAATNDFLFSLNDIVAGRNEDVVVVLNNDMRFDPGFVDPLLEHFADPRVFAANSRILDWDGSEVQNAPRRARLERGWFYKWWDADATRTAWTIEAGGGASAYHRERFAALGGFDALYRPGYYEDFDLSYRAWERGWRSVYEPRSVIYHRVSASMVRELGVGRQAKVIWRNHLLFTVKCVGGTAFVLSFLALLPVRALRPLLRGDTLPLRAFWSAIPRIPSALRRRFARRGPRPRTEEIFRECERPFA